MFVNFSQTEEFEDSPNEQDSNIPQSYKDSKVTSPYKRGSMLLMAQQPSKRKPETVDQLYFELHNYIEELDGKVQRVIEKHQKDFLTAYRSHMMKVQKELEYLRGKADDQQAARKHDQRLLRLQDNLEWFRTEAIALGKSCQAHQRDKDIWKNKASNLEDDRRFLQYQVKAQHRQNKLLKIQLKKSQKRYSSLKNEHEQSILIMNEMVERLSPPPNQPDRSIQFSHSINIGQIDKNKITYMDKNLSNKSDVGLLQEELDQTKSSSPQQRLVKKRSSVQRDDPHKIIPSQITSTSPSPINQSQNDLYIAQLAQMKQLQQQQQYSPRTIKQIRNQYFRASALKNILKQEQKRESPEKREALQSRNLQSASSNKKQYPTASFGTKSLPHETTTSSQRIATSIKSFANTKLSMFVLELIQAGCDIKQLFTSLDEYSQAEDSRNQEQLNSLRFQLDRERAKIKSMNQPDFRNIGLKKKGPNLEDIFFNCIQQVKRDSFNRKQGLQKNRKALKSRKADFNKSFTLGETAKYTGTKAQVVSNDYLPEISDKKQIIFTKQQKRKAIQLLLENDEVIQSLHDLIFKRKEKEITEKRTNIFKVKGNASAKALKPFDLEQSIQTAKTFKNSAYQNDESPSLRLQKEIMKSPLSAKTSPYQTYMHNQQQLRKQSKALKMMQWQSYSNPYSSNKSSSDIMAQQNLNKSQNNPITALSASISKQKLQDPIATRQEVEYFPKPPSTAGNILRPIKALGLKSNPSFKGDGSTTAQTIINSDKKQTKGVVVVKGGKLMFGKKG